MPWGRTWAGPRWYCSSPPRCSPWRPGCFSTGGPRPCERYGVAERRWRRPGPERCSRRFSPSGPYGSNGSELGCELSTARRAGTGYGRARAGECGQRRRGEAGPAAWPLLAGAGQPCPAGRSGRRSRWALGSLADGAARERTAVCERGKGRAGHPASFKRGLGQYCSHSDVSTAISSKFSGIYFL